MGAGVPYNRKKPYARINVMAHFIQKFNELIRSMWTGFTGQEQTDRHTYTHIAPTEFQTIETITFTTYKIGN